MHKILFSILLCLAFTVSSQAAPSACGSAVNAGASSVTTISLTCTPTAGASLVIFVSGLLGSPGPTAPTISDGQSNSFWIVSGDRQDIAGSVDQPHSGHVYHLAWIVCSVKTTASDTITVNWTNGQTFVHIFGVIVPGVNTTDCWDGTNSTDGSASVASPQSSAAANGHSANTDILIAYCYSSQTAAATSGWTNMDTSLTSDWTEYKTANGAGNSTATCTWTGGNSSWFSVELVALRQAGATYGLTFYQRQALSCSTNTQTTCNFYPTPNPAHAFFYVQGMANGTNTLSWSDSASNSYTSLLSLTGTNCFGAGGGACSAAYLANVGAGVTEVTMSISPNDNTAATFVEYENVAVSPLDQNGTANVTTGPGAFTGNNITNTNANDLNIGFAPSYSTTTSVNATCTGSYTLIIETQGIDDQSTMCYQIVSSTGTYAVTGSQATTGAFTESDTFSFKLGNFFNPALMLMNVGD